VITTAGEAERGNELSVYRVLFFGSNGEIQHKWEGLDDSIPSRYQSGLRHADASAD
jgi:hypothetical protein